MIFQDPISSLNPRRKVGRIVGEGLDIWGVGDAASRRAKVDEVLDAVGLDPATARDRRPHEFSGGQCQRISIARALVTDPKMIICDEPVSALDVSVQAQILNLLEDMKARYGLTLVFIAHDLAVVKNVSDRVAVMYLGKLCEVGSPDLLYAQPAHPYTAALLSAIPEPDPERHDDAPPPSSARSRRTPTRRAAAASAPAARAPRPVRGGGADDPRGADGQFVACHFPLAPGEALETADGSASSIWHERSSKGSGISVFPGEIVGIYVTPAAGRRWRRAPLRPPRRSGGSSATATPRAPAATRNTRVPRDVTLIEREAVDAAHADLAAAASRSPRPRPGATW